MNATTHDCCCGDESPLTEKSLDGWRATIEHLAVLGYPAVVPAWAIRGLRRRGGCDGVIADMALTARHDEVAA